MCPSARIVYNPEAGPSKAERNVRAASAFWQDHGWQVSLEPTRYPGHAAELARRAVDDRCILVLAAGGDGTLSEVARGLADTETVMGILPLGTANVYAKLLGLVPQSFLAAPNLIGICNRLISGQVQEVDLGVIHAAGLSGDGHRFLAWAGAGFSGYLIERLEPRPKWVKQATGRYFGWISYLIPGLRTAARFSGTLARVTVDNAEISGRFVLVLVAKSQLYGGGLLKLSSETCLDNGLLDVWMFKGQGLIQTLAHLFCVIRVRHLTDQNIIHLQGRRVVVRPSDSARYEVDGEPAGAGPFYATVLPRRLRLLVPEGVPTTLFSRPGTDLHSIA